MYSNLLTINKLVVTAVRRPANQQNANQPA